MPARRPGTPLLMKVRNELPYAWPRGTVALKAYRNGNRQGQLSLRPHKEKPQAEQHIDSDQDHSFEPVRLAVTCNGTDDERGGGDRKEVEGVLEYQVHRMGH